MLVPLKVRADTLLIGFDPDVANIVSYNMLDSLEILAGEAIEADATTTTVDGGAESALTAGDVITMNKLREQVAILREGNVQPLVGDAYAAIIHPDVEYDLMVATLGTDWAAFAIRQGEPEWRNGMVAKTAGLAFFSTPRAAINVDGGASGTDTYSNYILGQDSFGKAVSIPPRIIDGPVTDKLRRFMPLGWHAYLDYKVIRTAAARNLISASSIGS